MQTNWYLKQSNVVFVSSICLSHQVIRSIVYLPKVRYNIFGIREIFNKILSTDVVNGVEIYDIILIHEHFRRFFVGFRLSSLSIL